jgi:hypothetical protein
MDKLAVRKNTAITTPDIGMEGAREGKDREECGLMM